MITTQTAAGLVSPFISEPQIVEGPNGQQFEMVIEGTVELVRGPLGRFVDLAEQITAVGLEVPPLLVAVLAELQQPHVTTTTEG